jgi:hypothetical protein
MFRWNPKCRVRIAMQRIRDTLAGQELTLDYFMRRAAEGWSLAAVEWVRGVADPASDADTANPSALDQLPYGLQVAADGTRLEENALEKHVLLLILEKVVQEKRVTEIAAELNSDGLHMRGGGRWTAAAVFDLLPRLIEAGPRLLASSEWRATRRSASKPN